MKYMLIMQLCSALTGSCQEPYRAGIEFNNFYDCGVSGYSIAGTTIKQMNKELISENKLYLRFGCIEQNLEEEDA